jgi:hypothetical protein
MNRDVLATLMVGRKYPVRTCKSTHECAFCESGITLYQEYYDGGYGRRAHCLCAEAVDLEFKETQKAKGANK